MAIRGQVTDEFELTSLLIFWGDALKPGISRQSTPVTQITTDDVLKGPEQQIINL